MGAFNVGKLQLLLAGTALWYDMTFLFQPPAMVSCYSHLGWWFQHAWTWMVYRNKIESCFWRWRDVALEKMGCG